MDKSKQAFPTSKRKTENYMDAGGYGRTRTVTVEEGGMTLREYYAGLAMQGMLANPSNKEWEEQAESIQQLAEAMSFASLLFADALIARLEEDK